MCSCHQAWSHHNWLFVGLRQFSQDKQTAEENQCTVGNVSGNNCYLLYIYLPLRAKNIILICWILLDLLNCVDQLDLVCQSVRSYWSVRNLGSFSSDFSTVQCCDVTAIIHHNLYCFRLMDWCLFSMSTWSYNEKLILTYKTKRNA